MTFIRQETRYWDEMGIEFQGSDKKIELTRIKVIYGTIISYVVN